MDNLDNVSSEPIRQAFRDFRGTMSELDDEHFHDQCMWWIISQLDRMQREIDYLTKRSSP
jgi:hypothetical protein